MRPRAAVDSMSCKRDVPLVACRASGRRVMRFHQLGQSELRVSEICLGTMTFGQQNTTQEAHEQLDYAVERGVNFIDAAEMYPVPGRAETQGRTEQYIGDWLA